MTEFRTKGEHITHLLRTTKLSMKQIVRETGSSHSYVSRVNAGIVSRTEGVEYPIRLSGAARNERMRELRNEGYSLADLAHEFDLSIGYIEKIIK